MASYGAPPPAPGGRDPFIDIPPETATIEVWDYFYLFANLTVCLGIPTNEHQYRAHPIVETLYANEIYTWQGDFLAMTDSQIE